MKKISLAVFCLVIVTVNAQFTPEITSWMVNVTGLTGYSGLTANVQSVHYTNTDVYVSCTCIPGYDIGPWAGNPNTPANQNFCFKITHNPQQNTGTLTATPLGHVGIWTNGVSIFNARDAISYNNQNVWHQDALPNEGASFDDCLGHPAPNGEYHHHVNPTCLYDDQSTSIHSPIIGYAFDGFPIYGAYAYANANGTGGITRMRTGYRLRNITTRTTLPDGSAASFAGPVVSLQYPLGKYIEDYEFVSSIGDLDEHNGRFCVTPEYPLGTYAYFVTIDSNQTPVYPYTIGATYYGTVQPGNTGPQSGHNTIPVTATQYNPPSGIENVATENSFEIFPNPSNGIFIIETKTAEPYSAELFDVLGNLVLKNSSSSGLESISITSLMRGLYVLCITTESGKVISKRLTKM